MNVLVITNLYPPDIIGGYEVQCSEAVADLRQRGHDVTVLTSVPRRPLVESDVKVLRLLRTPDVYSPERASIRSPFWEFESNLLNVENLYVLIRALDDIRPDVCYLWNLVAVGGAGIIAALEAVEAPWVWQLGDAVPSMLCNFEGQLPDLGRGMAELFSGRFLACSHTVIDRIEKLVPIKGRTRVVPNWLTDTQPRVDRQYFDGTFLRAAYAGRVAEEKGVFLLPEIAASLTARGYRNFVIDVIGAGMVDALADRVSELGVREYVNVLGWIPKDQLRLRLATTDVFVFPAFSEDPMPRAPLEAASVGSVPLLPLVSGVSEWLVDGVHCLKAERTPQAFAETLARVLDGEVDVEAISKRGVSMMHGDLAIEKVMPVVESELVLAADRGGIKFERFEGVYRMGLIADAVLRRYVLERAQH